MSTSSDLDLLLHAILDAPTEDAPRLAYADLVERDDPERAELIRTQIVLANNGKAPQKCRKCDGKGIYETVVGGGDPVSSHRKGSNRHFTGKRTTTYRTMEKKTEPTLCVVCDATGVVEGQADFKSREASLLSPENIARWLGDWASPGSRRVNRQHIWQVSNKGRETILASWRWSRGFIVEISCTWAGFVGSYLPGTGVMALLGPRTPDPWDFVAVRPNDAVPAYAQPIEVVRFFTSPGELQAGHYGTENLQPTRIATSVGGFFRTACPDCSMGDDCRYCYGRGQLWASYRWNALFQFPI